MHQRSNYRAILTSNRPFQLFLYSQAISGVGDTFQLVAFTAFIFGLTDSGLWAGFGLLCMPLCSLVFTPLVGGLSDMLPEKFMLVILDLLRGILCLFFVICHDFILLLVLLFLLAVLSVFYGPPSRKMMAAVLEKEEIVAGNALMGGLSGAAYLAGPILAGILIDIWGIELGFVVNSISFLLSALIILFIHTKHESFSSIAVRRTRIAGKILKEISMGMKYFFSVPGIRELSVISTAVCLWGAAVNFSFFTYAFKSLRVTNRGWGLMLSVLYGSNLTAMLFSALLDRFIHRFPRFFMLSQLLIISFIWFNYSMTLDYGRVLLLLLVEGTAASLFWIVLGSQFQLHIPRNYLGRVVSVNDMINNVGKLAGIGAGFLMLGVSGTGLVFFVSGIGLFAFTAMKLLCQI